MSSELAFALSFAATLATLCAVLYTGFRARRRLHIACVVLTVVLLGVTIRVALRLGDDYDLAAAGIITPIHLFLARATTVALLFPIATGIRTVFVPRTRTLHKRLALTAVVLMVITAVTGTIMILNAVRIAPHGD